MAVKDILLEDNDLIIENGDFKTHTIKDGIVVVKKLAVIPNGTVI